MRDLAEWLVLVIENKLTGVYNATGPEKLWATIFMAAILGILFFVVIRAAELVVLRGRPGVGS